ncbi:MAG: glycerol-3-phosphate dehydrogenase/oxidase [Pirellulales bacterium]|nr:glycerol-3-phosphate dehydrogenase/oxidase [Pirellulales bacterium]
MTTASSPVLILGAGINGAALARELVLNQIPVCLVDTADIGFGATAYSSRLIHGGLRYLEHGEFDLVRESLAERNRLVALAPHLVRPLRLYIPVAGRWGGLFDSARRFLGFERPARKANVQQQRGLWLVRLGLGFYDAYAGTHALERYRVYRVEQAAASPIPRVDAQRFHWLCAYSDAQVQFPERFTLALLADAQRLAKAGGVPFEVHTYRRAELHGDEVRLAPVAGLYRREASPSVTLRPAAIVNATGAWVDFTLSELRITQRKFMGGTKGSHFLTYHPGLRAALGDGAIYAEAPDGRPVFIMPFDDGTLVGTTDLPYSDRPETAVASPDELQYLVETVNAIIAGVRLTLDDIVLHYSGIRPLPATGAGVPAAITRRHWMEEHADAAVPCYSIIGGKLTTCRSLAESATAMLLARLGRPRMQTSQDRPLPGAEDYPASPDALVAEQQVLASSHGLRPAQVAAMWRLCGTQVREILAAEGTCGGESLVGTELPVEFCRWSMLEEWTVTLADLVERRLMLLYEPGLSEATLRQLGQIMVAAGRASPDELERQLGETRARLAQHFGRTVPTDPLPRGNGRPAPTPGPRAAAGS